MLAHSASHATFSSTTAGSIALLLLLLFSYKEAAVRDITSSGGARFALPFATEPKQEAHLC